MGPYAITINRKKEVVNIPFTKTIEDGPLTVKQLAKIAGEHPFDVEQDNYDRYVVKVHATRLETDLEQAARVAKEEAYMVEYKRRKNNQTKA
jgi:hypothetical protein